LGDDGHAQRSRTKGQVRFDPKDPKDGIPVQNEWQGFKVWSVG
jgi:hypothetical protein